MTVRGNKCMVFNCDKSKRTDQSFKIIPFFQRSKPGKRMGLTYRLVNLLYNKTVIIEIRYFYDYREYKIG